MLFNFGTNDFIWIVQDGQCEVTREVNTSTVRHFRSSADDIVEFSFPHLLLVMNAKLVRSEENIKTLRNPSSLTPPLGSNLSLTLPLMIIYILLKKFQIIRAPTALKSSLDTSISNSRMGARCSVWITCFSTVARWKKAEVAWLFKIWF